MTTPALSVLRLRERDILKLIVAIFSLLLVSCSHLSLPKENVAGESKGKADTAQKAPQREPRLGDTRVINGVEYIYGKNVKYMVSQGEPEYAWVRKDQYFPDASESPRSRTDTPSKEQKVLAERVAQLEKELKAGGTAQPASPAEPPSKKPISTEAGGKWTNYAQDGNRIKYFYDKDTVEHPSRDLVRVWRKREFPSAAAQKEIVTLDEIDCREARYRSIKLHVAYRDGTTDTSEKVAPWAKIYVDSPEEIIMNEQCK